MNTPPLSGPTKSSSNQPVFQRITAQRWGGWIWLAVVTAGLLFSVAVQAQFTYTTNHSTITITGYTGAGGAVLVTNIINGLPVTCIYDFTFKYRTNLTSVTISTNVAKIGTCAFIGCAGLSDVTIPDSVRSIGALAFSDCASFTNIIIGNNVNTIGERAYNGCTNVTSLTIPNSVTSVGYDSFTGCINLNTLNIDATFVWFNFSGLTNLTHVTFGKHVNTIANRESLAA